MRSLAHFLIPVILLPACPAIAAGEQKDRTDERAEIRARIPVKGYCASMKLKGFVPWEKGLAHSKAVIAGSFEERFNVTVIPEKADAESMTAQEARRRWYPEGDNQEVKDFEERGVPFVQYVRPFTASPTLPEETLKKMPREFLDRLVHLHLNGYFVAEGYAFDVHVSVVLRKKEDSSKALRTMKQAILTFAVKKGDPSNAAPFVAVDDVIVSEKRLPKGWEFGKDPEPLPRQGGLDRIEEAAKDLGIAVSRRERQTFRSRDGSVTLCYLAASTSEDFGRLKELFSIWRAGAAKPEKAGQSISQEAEARLKAELSKFGVPIYEEMTFGNLIAFAVVKKELQGRALLMAAVEGYVEALSPQVCEGDAACILDLCLLRSRLGHFHLHESRDYARALRQYEVQARDLEKHRETFERIPELKKNLSKLEWTAYEGVGLSNGLMGNSGQAEVAHRRSIAIAASLGPDLVRSSQRNLTCALAEQKKYGEALELLAGRLEIARKEKKLADEVKWAEEDPSLENLRSKAEFKSLIQKYQSP